MIRAARLIARPGTGAALRLTKTLPVASGIGGGSADAAASLRLLCRLHGTPMPDQAAILALGADVPVCLASRAARMSGIGERLDPLVLPTFWIVLANPGQPVSTGAVFAGLARTDGAPLPALPAFADAPALFAWLAATRNDLERPAIDHLPVIATLRSALAAQPGCALARMSGSGATCFGLFADEPSARAAAAVLARAEPGWWLAAAPVPASGSA